MRQKLLKRRSREFGRSHRLYTRTKDGMFQTINISTLDAESEIRPEFLSRTPMPLVMGVQEKSGGA